MARQERFGERIHGLDAHRRRDFALQNRFTARNVESYTVDSGLELDKTYRFGVCADGRKGSSEIVYAPALELEDLTSPGIAFVGESTATESCIAFRY